MKKHNYLWLPRGLYVIIGAMVGHLVFSTYFLIIEFPAKPILITTYVYWGILLIIATLMLTLWVHKHIKEQDAPEPIMESGET